LFDMETGRVHPADQHSHQTRMMPRLGTTRSKSRRVPVSTLSPTDQQITSTASRRSVLVV